MSECVRENNDLNIDWNKFKVEVKGHNFQKAKQGYIEFCKMLNEVDFELVGNYIGAKEKVEIKYKFNDDIKFNMKPSKFKDQTYKRMTNFKKQLKVNNDKFIKFIGLTNGGNLIAKIKTFDGGEINVDTGAYGKWDNGRKDFYRKLKEIGGHTTDYYIGKETKIDIYIDGVKLNPICPNGFKIYTHKAIVNFKSKLKENNDEFIRFIKLSGKGSLIAKIKTFDSGVVNLDIRIYNKFSKSRKDTYNYCKSKGCKILSPYISTKDKMLIDFNCGHKPNWIIPSALKYGIGCPTCDESKGEKVIREYLENNNIEFIQEYRFDGCRYKNQLPFDFYIPNKNLIIEFDGIQHFEVRDYFGGEKEFEDTKIRDKIKNDYCKDNNINLLRIPYWELSNIEKILDVEFEMLRKVS